MCVFVKVKINSFWQKLKKTKESQNSKSFSRLLKISLPQPTLSFFSFIAGILQAFFLNTKPTTTWFRICTMIYLISSRKSLSVCSCHVTYAFHSKSTLYSCRKWLSVRLPTKWFWIRVQMRSLENH